MHQKSTVSLITQDHSYTTQIYLGFDFKELIALLKTFSDSFVIVTHTELAKLYGNALLQSMTLEQCKVELLTIPSGEVYKTREIAIEIQDRLLEAGCDTHTLLIALGGGVLSDIAGFIAATTLRGLPWIVIPTTLLAMVDASIGGKTGVNTPAGKNLVGAIYPPKVVWIDLHFLKTLPNQEWRNGFAEIIKYGAICDKELFALLETYAFTELTQMQQEVLHYIIERSCQHKAHIVQQDLRDHSIRKVLNFGHTVGHAIEQLYDYRISHGEAIAMGMLVEGYISLDYGLSKEDFSRLHTLIRSYQFYLQLEKKATFSDWMQLVQKDKKSLRKMPRCVLLRAIGSAHRFDGHYCTMLSEQQLFAGYEWMFREFS